MEVQLDEKGAVAAAVQRLAVSIQHAEDLPEVSEIPLSPLAIMSFAGHP